MQYTHQICLLFWWRLIFLHKRLSMIEGLSKWWIIMHLSQIYHKIGENGKFSIFTSHWSNINAPAIPKKVDRCRWLKLEIPSWCWSATRFNGAITLARKALVCCYWASINPWKFSAISKASIMLAVELELDPDLFARRVISLRKHSKASIVRIVIMKANIYT